jgi:TonB family protein
MNVMGGAFARRMRHRRAGLAHDASQQVAESELGTIVRCQRTRARFPRSAFNRYQAFHATATIRLEVMSDGSIGQVAITKSTSDDDLDAAALRAARAMKCKPVGEGTTVTALVTFTFDLR